MIGPQRPALRWHGGKWRLAPWILQYLPPHRCYVEPYGGAASVLLRKPSSHAEVYNDLDGEVENYFRLLRGPEAARLVEQVALTPFAREEFILSTEPTEDPVERARRLVVRSFMGFGSNGHNIELRTGFRANSTRSGSTPATDWSRMPEALAAIARRLAGVCIEQRLAIDVMRQHDGPATLHYVDPPYVHATRSSRLDGRNDYHGYTHEMVDADHAALLEAPREIEGAVVLSGYPDPLYDDALAGWRRETRMAHADGARERTEVLWINPAADRRLGLARAQQLEMAHA
jgi:DNA adenine methylase